MNPPVKYIVSFQLSFIGTILTLKTHTFNHLLRSSDDLSSLQLLWIPRYGSYDDNDDNGDVDDYDNR